MIPLLKKIAWEPKNAMLPHHHPQHRSFLSASRAISHPLFFIFFAP